MEEDDFCLRNGFFVYRKIGSPATHSVAMLRHAQGETARFERLVATLEKIAREHAAALKREKAAALKKIADEQAAVKAQELRSAKYWREQIAKAEAALIGEPLPKDPWVKAVYDAAQKKIKSRAAKEDETLILSESFGEMRTDLGVN